MAIKKTGNEHFDRLYTHWIKATKNTSQKMQALKSFEKLTKRDDAERVGNEIMIAVNKQQAQREKKLNERQFVPEWPSLAVYLNQRRYLDDELEDTPVEEKPLRMCDNHPEKESVYNVPPFLCADCLSERVMKNDPIVEKMREYSRANNIGKMSHKERIALLKANMSKMVNKTV